MDRKYNYRKGEINYNKYGRRMMIKDYISHSNILVEFDNGYIINTDYKNFRNGSVSNPYDKTVYGIGYLGEGIYKTKENGKILKCYDTWKGMIRRCYSEKFQEKEIKYKGCSVCEEWLNFQNFAKWFYENYYEIYGQQIDLDKDILHKGNKIYSPKNCVFAPHIINSAFIKNNNKDRVNTIGVHYNKKSDKYISRCRFYNFLFKKTDCKNLGTFDTLEEAFNVYKTFKENNIKRMADYYKDKIPKKLYDAMYNYKVEITD